MDPDANMLLQAPALAREGSIRHAFFTRRGGVSAGLYATLNGGLGSRDANENVRENRARMAAALGIETGRLVTPFQIHSPVVITATTPWTREDAPRADAVVTQVRGLAIGITTADCGPVLLADPEAGVIGAAHAGWKGALTGVVEATLSAMEALGAERSRIRVALGPMIHQENYEVGPELVARFTAEDAGSGRFFRPSSRAEHSLFDLPGYIVWRLKKAGVGEVEDLGLCTYADPERFFSYRRSVHRGEADYGRHVNAIALAP